MIPIGRIFKNKWNIDDGLNSSGYFDIKKVQCMIFFQNGFVRDRTMYSNGSIIL